MKKKTFENFLNNSYSKGEYEEILKHFENDKDFEELQKYLEEHWKDVGEEGLSEERCMVLRAKLQQKIQLSGIRAVKRVTGRVLNGVSKVAAILILPLIFCTFHFYWQWRDSGETLAYAEIYCPLGTRTKFDLPDGTTGWLNSGSTLKYPVMFKTNRSVELEGQAFFNVIKNKKLPFSVHTNLFNIQVLGTQFDVTAYPEDKLFEVVLEAGEVRIFSNETKHKQLMRPSQRFMFDKNLKSASLSEVDTRCYTSWKDGQLIFRNTPLSEVMVRLGRWYNVEFECRDKTLLDIPYRATFQDERLEHVLQLLTMTAPISYKITESTKQDGEIYEKQKIIISRN